MKEENVTKNILYWLEENNWTIICYDFPQSGTGVLLHPDSKKRVEKNKGGIIPDIIAVKNNIALFFENKDRFYEPDFNKLNEIKTLNNFSESLNILLTGHKVEKIVYGIGIPKIIKQVSKAKTQLEKIDFLISTDKDKNIEIHYDIEKVF